MNAKIQYSDEPIGEVRGELHVVDDFLPSPEELVFKNINTKVTMSLSAESVAYFKAAAKKNRTQYQKLIRQLLDEYVARQKNRARLEHRASGVHETDR